MIDSYESGIGMQSEGKIKRSPHADGNPRVRKFLPYCTSAGINGHPIDVVLKEK